MARTRIHFFTEDIVFKIQHKTLLRSWITEAILAEGQRPDELNFILCSDNYLININREYLNHDTYTDTITFDYNEKHGLIRGDIFISIDRIRDNAAKFKAAETDELHRVMIHSTLHLLGYRDKTKADKEQMTQKEDHYLQLRRF